LAEEVKHKESEINELINRNRNNKSTQVSEKAQRIKRISISVVKVTLLRIVKATACSGKYLLEFNSKLSLLHFMSFVVIVEAKLFVVEK